MASKRRFRQQLLNHRDIARNVYCAVRAETLHARRRIPLSGEEGIAQLVCNPFSLCVEVDTLSELHAHPFVSVFKLSIPLER